MDLGRMGPISGTDVPNSEGQNIRASRVDCLTRARVLSLLYRKGWVHRSFWIFFWDASRLQGSSVGNKIAGHF
ncbi:hypothetical protein PIB30_053332 [Stylosanthes scabra]|uniref:Uncharacterized protein n=1 Tax=Stylosanthes scabra TaxID=79078 RepID=A0ABU6SIE2_9FABA|nr:hypothetical protein [Stylosanthes scabra]